MIKYRKYLLKLKDAFLEENVQNTKMLDLYLKYLEGEASEQDLEDANKQLAEILKSLGMGVLVVLPFSPVSIPYLVKKAKENKEIRVLKEIAHEALKALVFVTEEALNQETDYDLKTIIYHLSKY